MAAVICMKAHQRNKNHFKQLICRYCHSKNVHSSSQESISLNRLPLEKSTWQSAIGLEIHAQITSQSKLFSSAATKYNAPTNSQVTFLDASFPGTLPVLNKSCVEAGILTALALQCQIHPESHFDRKHYFYSDMPAGYQITQQRSPLATNGKLHYLVFNPAVHREPFYHMVHIQQLQLEQDSGKSLHDEIANHSLIDLNRAGVGLMEIITAPDLKDGEDAAAFIKELRLILLALGTCDCKMNEGSLRVDANVSINQPGESLGTRTEIKNLNSVRFVAKAIDYEIKRQIFVLESGGIIVNETRSFDQASGKTVAMRDKEMEQDYRFIPEPNLPPLHVESSLILELSRKIVELPESKREWLIKRYNISLRQAIVIVAEDGLLDYFLAVMNDSKASSITVANLLIINVLGELNDCKQTFEQCTLQPKFISELATLLEIRSITLDNSRKVLSLMLEDTTLSPSEIIKIHELDQLMNDQELDLICEEILNANKKTVTAYHAGNLRKINKLIGDVKKAVGLKADLAKVANIFKTKLEERKKLPKS